MGIKDTVPYIQSFGIITSFLLAAFTAWRSLRTARVSAYMDLVKSHRELWFNTVKEDGFEKIFSASPEDWVREITNKESLFANFLINHLSCSFELMKVKNVITPEGLEEDIIITFSHPVPRRVWNESKKFRNKDFVLFVDSILVNSILKVQTEKLQ